jgi:O-antigen ligase/tetratricopeptide (TPR) repeat protein
MSKRRARRELVAAQVPSGDFLSSPLRYFGIALVCAKLAVIPVIFDHSSDVPFSVIKALLSHALAYVLAAVVLGLIVRYGRIVFVWSWLHIPVLAFLVANALATLFANDTLLALYGAHTRMIGLGTVADCVLLYFAIALLARTPRDTLAMALSFLAGSSIVLAYEFVQFLGKDPFTWAIDPASRPFSTIGQTTSLAEYLTVVAVGAAAVAVFASALPAPARLLLLAYSGLAVAGTVVTQTRSAVLGMVLGGALLVTLTWGAHPDRRARVGSVVGAAVGAAALTTVLLVTPLGARFLSTLETSVTAEDDSGVRLEGAADARIALYRIAFEMLRDRPVLGHGPDNFLAALPRFRSDTEPFEVQDNPTSSAHSWLAQAAATSGAIGAIAFIAIAVVAVALTFRSGFRPAAWAALGMLGAFLGAGLTTVNAIATDWLFWAAAGTVASVTSAAASAESKAPGQFPATPPRDKRGPLPRMTLRSLTAYACIGLGIVMALTTLSAVDASRSAKASQVARLQGQSQLAIDLGLRATRSDPLRPQYWNTLGLAHISANRLGEAVSAFDRASKLAPYDVRYDGDLARAYAAQVLRGDQTSSARAREVADRAVRTDPNNPLAHQTRAVVMQATGDFPEALRSSERAIALDRTTVAGHTTRREFYLTGLQLLNALGRSQDAIALAGRGIARLPDEAARGPLRIEFARALVATGELAQALIAVETVLAVRPNDPTAQQLRAQIRAALGN